MKTNDHAMALRLVESQTQILLQEIVRHEPATRAKLERGDWTWKERYVVNDEGDFTHVVFTANCRELSSAFKRAMLTLQGEPEALRSKCAAVVPIFIEHP